MAEASYAYANYAPSESSLRHKMRIESHIRGKRPVWTQLNWTPPTTATDANANNRLEIKIEIRLDFNQSSKVH